MVPLSRGHPDKRTTPLERPRNDMYLNINLYNYTPDERPPLSKGHISGVKGVASQQGLHSVYIYKGVMPLWRS